MAEERITIKIDADGRVEAVTEGFRGEICVKELESILAGVAEMAEIREMDEYYQGVSQQHDSLREVVKHELRTKK